MTSPANGKVNVGYFVDWGIYARQYFPKHVPATSLTHILYSFADVKPDTGEVFLTDTWSGQQIRYTDVEDPDSWNDPPGRSNLYGNFKRFGLIKRHNRALKVLLSIGGWTYRSHFWPMAGSETCRQTFAQTAVQLLEDNGLDGIDVDWEYPADSEQAHAFTLLLQGIRSALDAAQAKRTSDPPRFLLTAAVSADKSKVQTMDLSGMDQYLDFWNIMAYDYAGSWSDLTGHHANLYNDSNTSPASEASGDDAVKTYTNAGVSASKLVFGLPLYGRAFASTAGLKATFQGVGPGSWENGVWDLKALPHAGASVTEDTKYSGASYSYDPSQQLLISYDTPAIFDQKTKYINDKGLAGAMYWELSSDYTSSSSVTPMVLRVASKLGKLDSTNNCIDYPYSKFDNVRNGFTS
ncbi:glycoside hydrolase family 18 protein [Tilletiaria anomala UBC 951]|uniref:chitinase n=1 Tax=Tilletiaria anomala (strain ATCC 24038 / CBS 436.72 / UBC 951) TaxID=1037660 RepID=A0A066WNV1_TILAU|nr:glycoside hydrolase family 18 protein [Tilletiaria anomala UBC 951]KDN52285.1 glycoside hydrolase family 18 protein [Tilletiaria anomala UBC 951]